MTRWRKVKGSQEAEQELVIDGVVVATVKQDLNHSNRVWIVGGPVVEGKRHMHDPTMRDAKRFAERLAAAAPRTEEGPRDG